MHNKVFISSQTSLNLIVLNVRIAIQVNTFFCDCHLKIIFSFLLIFEGFFRILPAKKLHQNSYKGPTDFQHKRLHTLVLFSLYSSNRDGDKDILAIL